MRVFNSLITGSEMPAAVVLGAKGAGKTFAWSLGQSPASTICPHALVSRGLTADIRQLDLFSGAPPSASIFPLLGSRNMEKDLRANVRAAEEAFWQRLGPPAPDARRPMSDDELHAALGRPLAEIDGLCFWTRHIAARLGLPEGAGASIEDLAGELARRELAVCLAIDGLEDAFQPSPRAPLESDQQRLLRGLLQRFTAAVSELGTRHLGVVTFVRRDLAQDAIPQNFGQFEALHAGSWLR